METQEEKKGTESVDRNWISDENRRSCRDQDVRMLAEMKALELEFQHTHRRVVKKTLFGVRIKYVRK